jgi:hypothetical protein
LWLPRFIEHNNIASGEGRGEDLLDRGSAARVHVNDRDASRAKIGDPRSARGREAEIPCGALCALPVFIGDGLRIEFEKGRVRRLETGGDLKALSRAWAAESGDRDRLGEFVLGCNPLLTPGEGTGLRPYYGFGDGVIRLALGENIESGRANRASLHRVLFLTDGPIAADGRTLLRDGAMEPGRLGAGLCALSVYALPDAPARAHRIRGAAEARSPIVSRLGGSSRRRPGRWRRRRRERRGGQRRSEAAPPARRAPGEKATDPS